MKKFFLLSLLMILSELTFSQPDKYSHQVSCFPTWQYAVTGDDVGERSLTSCDIDNSGTEEIISAYDNYWYIMEYDTLSHDYEFLWISETYEGNISRINVFDINNDNIMEICVGFTNGSMKIYAGDSKQLLKSFPWSPDYLDGIRDIEFGDIDNDGYQELAISTYSSITAFNTADYSVKMVIPYPTFDFKIANVDNDAALELIASSGSVLECTGSNVREEWTFNPGQTVMPYRIKVADIDEDGKDEIFYAKGQLHVLDADLQTTKFIIDEEETISDFVVKDVNNDGIKEIIYGLAVWDYRLHCISSLNQSELWFVQANSNGIAEVCVSDPDNDGQLELLFGSGYRSAATTNLEIFNINTRVREWLSRDEEGPFRAIDIDDVDNDGVKEIVAASLESSHGYYGGILSVFDAVTHKAEWHSNNMLFWENPAGINSVKISDIDDDGRKEIIVAAGNYYEGKIWILDGITKELKSSKVFQRPDVDYSFYNFLMDDIDSDGQKEIVATTGRKYYVINPLDLSVEYSSPEFGYTGLTMIRTGMLNGDQVKDVVLNRSKLIVFDGQTHQMVQNSFSTASFDLFDWNGDGIDEIIAGAYQGNIYIMNGITLQPLDTVKVVGGMIDALVVTDLNNDGIPEIVYSSGGRIYFYATDTQYSHTMLLDNPPGEALTLIVKDINEDGKKEIVAGAMRRIIELSEDCYRCTWFALSKTKDDASCGATDGYIQLVPYGGQAPYNCTWNNGMAGDFISSLVPGTYIAEMVDQTGCKIVDTTVIIQSFLSGSIQAANESCNPAGDGSAAVTIGVGHPPYTYNWSNGSTEPSINNLHKGVYSVHVLDMKNCTLDLETVVTKDTFMLDIYKSDVNCFGGQTGNITVFPYSGSYPFTYSWNNGNTTGSNFNLEAGIYSVIVSDARGCMSSSSIEINQPSDIILNATSTPDDTLTTDYEGTATVYATGGVTPYWVRWDDPMQQITVKAINLRNGTYHAYITDSHYCTKVITVNVGSPNGISENEALAGVVLFPSPSSGMLNLDLGSLKSENIVIKVSDAVGKPVVEFRPTLNAGSKIPLDLTNMDPGIYLLRIQTSHAFRVFKFEIVK